MATIKRDVYLPQNEGKIWKAIAQARGRNWNNRRTFRV